MSTHYNALDLHDAHIAVIQDVMTERARQLNKFGPQDRPPFEWFLILSEEVGEVAKECVEMQFNDANHPNSNPEAYRKELVEVAAVALAALQNFDQRKAHAERVASREGNHKPEGPNVAQRPDLQPIREVVDLGSGPKVLVHCQEVCGCMNCKAQRKEMASYHDAGAAAAGHAS